MQCLLFTAPRDANKRTWFYRVRPSVVHGKYEKIDNGLISHDWNELYPNPNQLRWNPFDFPKEDTKIDFVEYNFLVKRQQKKL